MDEDNVTPEPMPVPVPGVPRTPKGDQDIWTNGNVYHPPGSEYAKEMTKWEALPSMCGPGLRPYVKRVYPTAMYLARARPEGGGFEIIDTKLDVRNDNQRSRLEADGWRMDPNEAIKHVEAQQREFAKLAAEREHEKKHKLSPRARAEVQRAEDAAGARHLPTIDETPIPRRRRVR